MSTTAPTDRPARTADPTTVATPGSTAADPIAGDRAAAAVLLAGSLAGLAIMALHPTGRDAVRNAAAGAPNTRLAVVHTAGILVQPLLLAASLALTRRLRAASRARAGGAAAMADVAAVGATAYFTLASVAAVAAAAASGFVAPHVLRHHAAADAPARATTLAMLDYTGVLNRTFARLDVLFTGAAVLLWSAAMLAHNRGTPGPSQGSPARPWSRTLAGFGLLLGAALAIGAGGGYLRMDIHGFGLVVLGQGAWLAGVAAHLWRPPRSR